MSLLSAAQLLSCSELQKKEGRKKEEVLEVNHFGLRTLHEVLARCHLNKATTQSRRVAVAEPPSLPPSLIAHHDGKLYGSVQ